VGGGEAAVVGSLGEVAGRHGLPGARLVVVCRADPSGRYEWLPSSRRGDVTIALDGLAHVDLVDRHALLFDSQQSWEDREADERRVTELMRALGEHRDLQAMAIAGHRLLDFAELRLRPEVTLLLRGWALARMTAASALVCDPAVPPALSMGLRAGLGMSPASVRYRTPPAIPGSRLKRVVAREAMRALVAGLRARDVRDVRVVAVAAGKLSLALGSLSASELRAAGVGAMPFPGLDHGNSALLALRRRLPLLPGYGPARARPVPPLRLPERLGLDSEAELDRALTLLVGRMLSGVAPELARSVSALEGLDRASSLRAILLPSAAYGASRVLIEWAHERGVRVGAIQHGIYAFREYDGGDRRADVVFGWGEGTDEQTHAWPAPRPRVLAVGVPGTPRGLARPPLKQVRRALIATSSIVDTPLVPVAFCEAFVQVLAPGLRRLAAAGVQLELRPHPNEDPGRYRRQLDSLGLSVGVSAAGPFRAAAQNVDVLISSTSSVAFEAAALGLPVLLWLSAAPEWVRRQHLVAPWIESGPGTFQRAEDFGALVDALLERPAEGLAVARELGFRLARYAQPFDRDAFIEGLGLLSATGSS
jgi:hypothetical protein